MQRYLSLTTFLDSLSKIISDSMYNLYLALYKVNHYHQYFYDWNYSVTRIEMFRIWQKLLDCLDDVTFGWKTTFSELYDRTTKVRKINISKTGSKITIESKGEAADNHSFQINGQLKQVNGGSMVRLYLE